MKTQKGSRKLHLRSKQKKRSMTNRDEETGKVGGEPEGGIATETKGVKNFTCGSHQQCRNHPKNKDCEKAFPPSGKYPFCFTYLLLPPCFLLSHYFFREVGDIGRKEERKEGRKKTRPRHIARSEHCISWIFGCILDISSGWNFRHFGEIYHCFVLFCFYHNFFYPR